MCDEGMCDELDILHNYISGLCTGAASAASAAASSAAGSPGRRVVDVPSHMCSEAVQGFLWKQQGLLPRRFGLATCACVTIL